jgi:hypothetical protein
MKRKVIGERRENERVRHEGSREIKKEVAWSRQRKSERTEKEKTTGERSDMGRKMRQREKVRKVGIGCDFGNVVLRAERCLWLSSVTHWVTLVTAQRSRFLQS